MKKSARSLGLANERLRFRRTEPSTIFSRLMEEPVRLEMTAQLNQLLADTMTLRDLYKKSHWQVARPDVLPIASSV